MNFYEGKEAKEAFDQCENNVDLSNELFSKIGSAWLRKGFRRNGEYEFFKYSSVIEEVSILKDFVSLRSCWTQDGKLLLHHEGKVKIEKCIDGQYKGIYWDQEFELASDVIFRFSNEFLVRIERDGDDILENTFSFNESIDSVEQVVLKRRPFWYRLFKR